MAIDQSKFPNTWHIDDDEIVEAIWHREDDGFSVTRSQSLADRLQEAGKLHRDEAGVPAVHRELERRMLALARAKRLQHQGGDYALVEPVESARYVLKLGGEKKDVTYSLYDQGDLGPFEMADLLSNLTGFRREFIVGTKLALITPGDTMTLKFGVSPIRFIITQRV